MTAWNVLRHFWLCSTVHHSTCFWLVCQKTVCYVGAFMLYQLTTAHVAGEKLLMNNFDERRAKFTSLGSLTDAVIEWANSLNLNPSGTRLQRLHFQTWKTRRCERCVVLFGVGCWPGEVNAVEMAAATTRPSNEVQLASKDIAVTHHESVTETSDGRAAWKNVKNRPTFAKVTVKIKVAQFFWLTVYIYLFSRHNYSLAVCSSLHSILLGLVYNKRSWVICSRPCRINIGHVTHSQIQCTYIMYIIMIFLLFHFHSLRCRLLVQGSCMISDLLLWLLELLPRWHDSDLCFPVLLFYKSRSHYFELCCTSHSWNSFTTILEHSL